MQNRNRSLSHTKPSFFDQVFAAARERTERGSDDGMSAIGSDDEPGADERGFDELLDGAALLRVLRDPIDWLLALAYRLAGDDPVDMAAIGRVHAAFHARLRGQAARVRTSDVLLVLGLLMSAFDPRLVLRTVSAAVSEAVQDARPTETPIAFFVANPEPIAAIRPSYATAPRPSCCAFHALLAQLIP